MKFMNIIGGKFKGRKLQGPKGDARPTSSLVRGALFNICQTYIEGTEFLDLFSGVGAIGLEALSRGAKFATFVEKDRGNSRIIEANIETLGVKEFSYLLKIDVFLALQQMKTQFDIIFADPPYGKTSASLSNEVLEVVDKSELLKADGCLFLEDSPEGSQMGYVPKRLALASERKLGSAVLREYRLIT